MFSEVTKKRQTKHKHFLTENIQKLLLSNKYNIHMLSDLVDEI